MTINIGSGINIGGGIIIGEGSQVPTLLLELDATSYSGSGSAWPATVGTNATLYGVPGWTGSAPGYFSFDPDDVEYASSPDLGDLSTWSVEVWFRRTASVTGQITMVAGNEFDLTDRLNFAIGTTRAPTSYNIAVGFYDALGWHNTAGYATVLNTWYQMVGTYDGATIRQYVNGSLDTQLSYSGTPRSGGEVRIARRWDSSDLTSTNFFPGDIGLVKIYSGDIGSGGVTTEWNLYRTRFGL